MYTFWIYLIALLVALPSAVLGGFLLLRKSMMVSDAISHAILPGLVIGFLVTKSVYSPVVLVLAAVFGVLTILMIDWLHQGTQIKKDASIGITYTFLFAVGVLLIANFTSGNTELDQECILYGDIGSTPLNTLILGGFQLGPKAVWILGGINVLVGLVVFIGWRALTLSSFDAVFAHTIGLKPKTWNLILMTLVAVCIVSAFDIVGAILIISFLSAPSCAAFLFGKNSKSYIALCVLFGLINTLLGLVISFEFDLILSGTLALTHGGLFLLTFLGHRIWKSIIA